MHAKKRLTRAHYETLAEFRYALRKFLHFSEAAAHAAGLTPQQHQAMLAIKGFSGPDRITVGQLAERLQVKHHSAVGLIDRLVREKYVRRLMGSPDHRQVRLALTARGETKLETLSAIHHDQLTQISPQLDSLLKALRATPSH